MVRLIPAVAATSFLLVGAAALVQIPAVEVSQVNPAAFSAAPPPPAGASPRNANYSIDATLDPARSLISGRETITWRNITSRPTSTLRFHLYWNAWKNTGSSWFRERMLAGTAGGFINRPEGDWAWIDVSSIRLLAGGPTPFVDLTAQKRYVAPDDNNQADQTLLEVSLPMAISPGEMTTLEVEWQAHVPRTFARTGRIGNFFLIAQWFPKIGVLENDGWNAHQFHASTEFFADYGAYDVRLRVPAAWVVGATGREQERRDNGDGTTTHRYVEQDVHDFAWTTSPDLIERKARFEHQGLPPVEMRLLLQPEHGGQEQRHFAATTAALRYYGEWYGPYPYNHLTIVDPAWQSQTGGMEYPTLFTAGTRWLVPSQGSQPEGVAVHEAGHQFWYGLVGSNEVEHAWLDEGFVRFATARVMERALAPRYQTDRFFNDLVPWLYRDLLISREDDDGLAEYRQSAKWDITSTPSWLFFPRTFHALTYSKTALSFHTLEKMLGGDVFQRILHTYFQRYQFKHPTPADFFAVANQVSGQDLTWFFDQTYRSSNSVDYAVSDLQSRVDQARGYTGRDDHGNFAAGSATDGSWETTVVVQRKGEAILPVELLVSFENGEHVRERWDGRDRWRAFHYLRPSKARSAQLDPDRVLLLDTDYTNNSRTLTPRGSAAATKWSLHWLVWFQDLLMTYGFFV